MSSVLYMQIVLDISRYLQQQGLLGFPAFFIARSVNFTLHAQQKILFKTI
jgi:ferritin